jgi:hypothetical protein
MAGPCGFLMIDDARQIAAHFARLPYSTDFKRVAPSREDDKVAKLETNRALQDVPETSRLLRTGEASVLMATDSPSRQPRLAAPCRLSRRGGGLRTLERLVMRVPNAGPPTQRTARDTQWRT